MNIIQRVRYGPAVVVVSGLPRSGTSMLMKMLDAGGMEIVTDRARTPDDDNPEGYYEDDRVKRLADDPDRSWVRVARGKALKVVSHLVDRLPPENFYRILFSLRDVAEVVKSQSIMLERRSEPNPVSDEESSRLYRQHLIGIRMKLAAKQNVSVLELNYGDTLAEPLSAAKRIRRFVGQNLDTEAMASVVNPDLYRNRKGDFLPSLALIAGCTLALMMSEPAQAYVGPGAGFAFLGSFLAIFVAFASALVAFVTLPVRLLVRFFRRRRALGRSSVKRIVVLGLDGLDPTLTEQWIAEGYLPNLKRLKETGSFSRLRTTYPSISPVAWSSFMTGVDPSRHNIYDFLSRDLKTYQPTLSSSEITASSRTFRVGNWVIPLDKPTVRNMRKSRAFWSILGEHGIRSDILRVPLTFPPEKYAGALLSAMCIPDLRGTQGSFTYFTTDPDEVEAGDEAPEGTGGDRQLVKREGSIISASLSGPRDPIRSEHAPLTIPFTVDIAENNEYCTLRIGKQKFRLAEREYSPWIRLAFKSVMGVTAHGIARFYVTKMGDQFGLYVTPINIDPAKPAFPISWPFYYSVYLSKLIGEFATLGLAEDTWALNERVIDEEAFLKQTLDNHDEREKMFFNSLKKSRDGVVACVFDGTDRLQHMFFRYLDDKHPANRGKDIEVYKNTIRDMYARADEMVGKVMRSLGPDEMFMVISDHGFQSFRRGVNLNTWLRDNGLLYILDGKESGDWFENCDWTRTKAYAFGLGGIYLNLKGRESQGVVEPSEAKALRKRIAEGLSGLRDEEADDIAINEVFDADDIYSGGPYRHNSPDLIAGYNRGYRASWEGAVGRVTAGVITDNTKSWSGDHCIDPRLVPGVLFCDRAVTSPDPAIGDLAPTILNLFGVDVPPHMTGKVLQMEPARAASGA
jgi:predicted AlkP superfamily phosphohydrolase/phosphomutase